MSETQEQVKPTDDNIITRRKHVKESLNVIRDKKERLHLAMKSVSSAEKPDKDMMAKLLEAYDMMTAQESQYLEILKNIVEIHELAVDDVAKEIEEKKKSIPVLEKKPEIATENKAEETTTPIPASSDELLELEETLKELQKVSAEAAAASKMHEQLVERLQLQKNKKATLNEIRKEKTADQRKQANEVFTEVEIAKLKVNTEKSAKGRKEQQLERLRKEALKRGIQLGAEEQKEKDIMIAAAEASTDRIPPVKDEEEVEPKEPEREKTEEEKLEERRKEIRENVRKEREKKEQINQQIRERLKAMEARKERVRQLRLALQQAADSPQTEKQARQALDDMFTNAAANLANLTAMRERLEAIQLQESSGSQESTEENTTKSSSTTDEIEEAVRLSFHNTMLKPSSEPSQLDRIERLLLQQNTKLDELSRFQQPVLRFRQSLLTSSPSLLHGLADCLLQLSAGQEEPPTLVHYLQSILEGAPSSERGVEENYYAAKQVRPEKAPIQETREKMTFEERKEPQVTTEDIIQLLVQTAKKVLELSETVEAETSQRLREVTCHLLSQLFPSVTPSICDSQLGAQVADCAGQYLGITVADCLDNVAYDLEELFRNEISYYQLMNSLNTIPDIKKE